MKTLKLAVALLVLPLLTFSQNEIYVSPGASGSGMTPGDPIALQGALDLSRTMGGEDIIYLAQGTYTNAPYTIDYVGADGQPTTLSGGWYNNFSNQSTDPFLTTIDGGDANRLLHLMVDDADGADTEFTIQNVRFANGYLYDEYGTAIFVEGGTDEVDTRLKLIIENTEFLDNFTEEYGQGGAIFTFCGFNISDCRFERNSAYNAGALYVGTSDNTADMERTVERTHFEDNPNYGNQGSTIHTAAPNLEISDCTILGNPEGGDVGNGSAILGNTDSYTKIDRCRFENIRINYWGSAVQAWNSSVDISNSLFINNKAGIISGYGAVAFYHSNGPDRLVRVVNCTFIGNEGQGTGDFAGSIHFRGNGADECDVYNCIIWNSGSTPVYSESGGIRYMSNTLLNGTQLGFTPTGPMYNTDPMFDADYQLLESSPAIDAGDLSLNNPDWLDYDGGIRVLGPDVDLGAYEFNAPPEDVLLTNTLIAENNLPGATFSYLDAAGQVGDEHNFFFAEGNGSNDADNGQFSIVGDELRIDEAANFEEQDVYYVYLRAVDTDGQMVETAWVLDISDVNDAPVLSIEMLDQQGVVDEFLDFNLDPGTFTDEDSDDELSYVATLGNGDPLPSWLTFDDMLLSFFGTPVQEELLEIKVTVTDLGGLEAEGNFELDISPLGIDDLVRGRFTLYPNPVTDFVQVDLSDKSVDFYAIYTTNGKLIDEGVVNTDRLVIDVRDLSSGIYILTIWDETKILSERFMVE